MDNDMNKERENRKWSIRQGKLLTVAIIAAMTLCIGCSGEQAADDSGSESAAETAAQPGDAAQQETDIAGTEAMEILQPEDAEAETAEPEPELEGIDAVVAYARTLDCSGDNCFIYYDSTTKQGSVLEDGQEITPKVGDYILAIGSTFKGLDFTPGLEYILDYYSEEHFVISPINEEFVNADVITAGIVNADESHTKYEFTVAGNGNQYDQGNEGIALTYGGFLRTTDRAKACVVVTDMNDIVRGIILEDGDSYTLAEDEILYLYLPKQATSFSTTTEDAEIFDNGTYDDGLTYILLYVSLGTNMEIPISIEYADGTTEELTIYITRQFAYNFS